MTKRRYYKVQVIDDTKNFGFTIRTKDYFWSKWHQLDCYYYSSSDKDSPRERALTHAEKLVKTEIIFEK